jgi:hypothetical protein
VIPPGALTAKEIDTWRLFAYSDCTVCPGGKSVRASWSQAPEVFERVDLSGVATFEAQFTVSITRGWSRANMTMRFWDWPSVLTSSNGSRVALAPLEVYGDGRLLFTHSYGGAGPVGVSAPFEPISPGIHRIVVKSGTPGLGVAVTLDTLEVLPLV